MTTAWTMRMLAGCCLALPIACVVSVGDDDDLLDDNVGGASGGSGTGSGGSSGSNGSGGAGGNGGSMSMVDGGSGGGGGAQPATAVCTPEAGDESDACLRCIKQQCCTEWQACNDTTCQQERVDLEYCVSMLDAVDGEAYGDCVSMASSTMDLLAQNSQAVMDCVNEEVTEGDAGALGTRCGVACWGEDIFF